MMNDEFENRDDKREDDFGLPEIEYRPLNDSNPIGQHDGRREDPRYSFSEEEEESSNATVWIVLAVLLVLGGGGYAAYHFIYKPRADREKQELLARQQRETKAKEQERLAQLQREQEEATRLAREDSIARAKADSVARLQSIAQGPIEVIDSPTGSYHVVISSNIDDDLLMDFARRLRRRGVSAKLIAPHGSVKFYRLAIGQGYDTYELANSAASSAGSQYSGNAWVLKY